MVWLREEPDQASLVRACYFDDPLIEAARRYTRSAEWDEVRAFLPGHKGLALDLGAGRGISSFALTSTGWAVIALEPDPSDIVGAGAIRNLANEFTLPIMVCEAVGESLPFPEGCFDLIYGREVLHHASSLRKFCSETARILKPGGTFIATREHVISRQEDIDAFLDNHPLHHLYGGECAYLLDDYKQAISNGGMHIQHVLDPLDSRINEIPSIGDDGRFRISQIVRKFRQRLIRRLPNKLKIRLSKSMNIPGRLYSFIAVKPDNINNPGRM